MGSKRLAASVRKFYHGGELTDSDSSFSDNSGSSAEAEPESYLQAEETDSNSEGDKDSGESEEVNYTDVDDAIDESQDSQSAIDESYDGSGADNPEIVNHNVFNACGIMSESSSSS